MDLHTYLSSPGAMTVSQLRARMVELGYDVKSDAQIRQWRHRYKGRSPSAENCMGLELASNGQMRRQDLRADDYWLIWTDLTAPLEEVG